MTCVTHVACGAACAPDIRLRKVLTQPQLLRGGAATRRTPDYARLGQGSEIDFREGMQLWTACGVFLRSSLMQSKRCWAMSKPITGFSDWLRSATSSISTTVPCMRDST